MPGIQGKITAPGHKVMKFVQIEYDYHSRRERPLDRHSRCRGGWEGNGGRLKLETCAQSWKELISLQGSDYRNSKRLKDAAEELNASGISKPELDKPLEALRHQSAAMNAEQEQIGGTEDVWKETPGLFFMHSVALARSRTDDNKAKETLSRIINDKNIDKGSQGMIFLVKSKMRNYKFVGTVKHANLNVVAAGRSFTDGYAWGLIRKACKLVTSEPRARLFLLMGHTATELKRIENLALHKPHLASDWLSPAHISFSTQVEYVPSVKSRQNKFKVVGAAPQNIEAAMALNKDEGKNFGKDILPMLVLMFGAGGIQTYLGIQGISKAQMEGYTYDPNWKDSLNSGNEPIGTPKLHRASLDIASSSRTALVEKMGCNLRGGHNVRTRRFDS
ncbi:hypothetical protein EV359DRAFT_67262 [Lentinula novae-zelandiae]|nr:hypothetical protein EV359DRAFT_67262 [Lentinula novae-zelandiae]